MTELGDGTKEQGIMAGFTLTLEEGGTILAFMLRRVGSPGGALTLG